MLKFSVCVPILTFFVCWVSQHQHLWNDSISICQGWPAPNVVITILSWHEVYCNSEYLNAWIEFMYSDPDFVWIPCIPMPTFGVGILQSQPAPNGRDHYTLWTLGRWQFGVFQCSNLVYIFWSWVYLYAEYPDANICDMSVLAYFKVGMCEMSGSLCSWQ